MKKNNYSISFTSVLLMIVAFLIYSSTGVFSKLTSMQNFLSIDYVIFFSMIIVALAVYAVLWQLILKKVPLSQAFLFKSTGIVFALIYAHFIFDERISATNVIGAFLIMCGIIVNSSRVTI